MRKEGWMFQLFGNYQPDVVTGNLISWQQNASAKIILVLRNLSSTWSYCTWVWTHLVRALLNILFCWWIHSGGDHFHPLAIHTLSKLNYYVHRLWKSGCILWKAHIILWDVDSSDLRSSIFGYYISKMSLKATCGQYLLNSKTQKGGRGGGLLR